VPFETLNALKGTFETLNVLKVPFRACRAFGDPVTLADVGDRVGVACLTQGSASGRG
jgi:hypothetical protein